MLTYTIVSEDSGKRRIIATMVEEDSTKSSRELLQSFIDSLSIELD